MENAYSKARRFISDAKDNTRFVSKAVADLGNAGEPESYLPISMKLFQQTEDFQAELAGQQQNSLQEGGFFSLQDEQASMCRIDAVEQLGTIPQINMIQATDEK
jgi:hypothetical protein